MSQRPRHFRRLLARYILGEEIARGGTGRIVEATDTHLRRSVAIKQLLPEKSNAAWGSMAPPGGGDHRTAFSTSEYRTRV